MLRHPWRPVPLFRAALPFTTGIILAMLFPCRYQEGLCIATALMFIPAFIIYYTGPSYFRRYVLQGFLIQLLFCLQGYSAVLLMREDLRPAHYTVIKADWCRLRLTEDVVKKGKRYRAQADIIAMGDKSNYQITCGKVLCYFLDSSSCRLAYNDEILVRNNLTAIPSPLIPGDFNYHDFMERRQVYAKLNIRTFHLVMKNSEDDFKGLAIQCRNRLLQILKEQLNGQEFAVAAALLIGEDDFVDKSLMTAFTATGTLHVLSVSGMHVGLIYMLLALLLGRLENKKYIRLFYYLLLYGFLWSYAFITGLSAPVVRSAMMLSLVLSGKLLQRKSPVLNTLTGSFLLLMMINPYWLTETGFQLSYLAVFGIMAMHPLLVNQFEFSRLWMHRIWELVSVSICAQLITVPVGLYYFGQFPNYFLISNLVIIPVSTIVIYGGIAVLTLFPVPYLGSAVTWVESLLLKLLNSITVFLGNLPGAVAYPGKISLLNCCMLYIIMLTCINWLSAKSANALKQLLIALIIWSIVLLLEL